jgi:predicted DCC family thiol-disulfide oxidoreductase YuxK
MLALVPRRVRDAGYDFVGRHRIRVFGKAERACPIVPAALGTRFVRR